MKILDTERLSLRYFTLDDAEFVLGLLNEPSFHELIGDKGARDLEGARKYLQDGPMASYEQHGFGLFMTTLRDGDVPIGMCGLLQRDNLDHPDVGFAFKPEFWGRGYATEAAAAVMDWGRREKGLDKIVAVTMQKNVASAAVLERIGLRFERLIDLFEDEPPSRLFS